MDQSVKRVKGVRSCVIKVLLMTFLLLPLSEKHMHSLVNDKLAVDFEQRGGKKTKQLQEHST